MAKEISRRTILRGLGTAVALPFLESMRPALSLAAATPAGSLPLATTSAGAPLRMAYLFVPNGVDVQNWFPERTGADYELTKTLEPLAGVKDDVLVLSGLTHDKGRANGDGAGDHARSASVFLTGYQPVKTHGANVRVGVSVDQIAAQQIGNLTRFPSLELGCDGGRNSGNCDSGYSCAYSNNISWSSETTPVAKETDPRRVFDRLFQSGVASEQEANTALRQRRRLSILDFVLDDARRLQAGVSGKDRRKVDEYFSSVREIEKRIAFAEKEGRARRIEEPDGLPAEAGQRLRFEEHLQLMGDLMALAFQTDATRVATFMFARAGSNRTYREVGVRDGHHYLSHHQRKRERLDKIQKIDAFHVKQLAYFVQRLKSISEGDGTLLDNCMVVYGSGLSDGNRHNNENLPVILAGRGGGTIDTGRHVRYEHETPMCNLFLSLLDRMGAEAESFGDGTDRLRGLTL